MLWQKSELALTKEILASLTNIPDIPGQAEKQLRPFLGSAPVTGAGTSCEGEVGAGCVLMATIKRQVAESKSTRERYQNPVDRILGSVVLPSLPGCTRRKNILLIRQRNDCTACYCVAKTRTAYRLLSHDPERVFSRRWPSDTVGPLTADGQRALWGFSKACDGPPLFPVEWRRYRKTYIYHQRTTTLCYLLWVEKQKHQTTVR